MKTIHCVYDLLSTICKVHVYMYNLLSNLKRDTQPVNSVHHVSLVWFGVYAKYNDFPVERLYAVTCYPTTLYVVTRKLCTIKYET